MIGVVLAGGLSTRMGVDKATLPFKEGNLLDYMVLLLQKAGCRKVYVSGEFEGYTCIPDKQKQLGPIGGISAVLNDVDDTEILFVPVDMPCLSVDILKTLILGSGDAACFENSPLPLVIKNTPEIRKVIERQVAKHKFSVKSLLEQLNTSYNTSYISTEQTGFLRNANTPKEWKAISA
jgi:molybdopterin-guanine dinucleotide biosynthesis protein A